MKKGEWQLTLLQIIRTRRPDLLPMTKTGLVSGFDEEQATKLREIVSNELIECGISSGELNDWGRTCDDLIGQIRPLKS